MLRIQARQPPSLQSRGSWRDHGASVLQQLQPGAPQNPGRAEFPRAAGGGDACSARRTRWCVPTYPAGFCHPCLPAVPAWPCLGDWPSGRGPESLGPWVLEHVACGLPHSLPNKQLSGLLRACGCQITCPHCPASALILSTPWAGASAWFCAASLARFPPLAASVLEQGF